MSLFRYCLSNLFTGCLSVLTVKGQIPAGFVPCADPATVKQQLKAHLADIQTIECTFIQTKTHDLLIRPHVARGLFFLQKPDKIRWEYQDPFSWTLIFNGNNVVRREGNTPLPLTASQARLLTSVSRMMVRLVGSGMLENGDFSHEFWCRPSETLVRVVPRHKRFQHFLKEIHLYFSSTTKDLVKLHMIEPSGHTLLEFPNQKFNQPIPAMVFQ